ncbi:MAG TPA: DUF5996 family protein, partial [Acidobacteriaceae bacterium]
MIPAQATLRSCLPAEHVSVHHRLDRLRCRMSAESNQWPELDWANWEPTASTLHMWTQIVGKVRLALSPLQAHWW